MTGDSPTLTPFWPRNWKRNMSRIARATRTPALVWLVCTSTFVAGAASPAPGVERFYVGTYSGRIYQSSLNLGLTNFGTISQVAATTDPSFLAFGPHRGFLYSVNEGPGTVSAFSVNVTNGNLTLLNQLS